MGSLKSNCQDSAAKSSSRLGSESQPSCPNSSDLRSATIAFSTGVNAIVEQLRVNRDQNNRRLDEIQDRLKDGLNDGLKNALEVAVDKVTRMMIKLHNNSSRVSTLLTYSFYLLDCAGRGLTLGRTTFIITLSMRSGKRLW